MAETQMTTNIDHVTERPRMLRAIKVLHTAVWALFAVCVLVLPVAVMLGQLRLAGVLAGAVMAECAVLGLNGGRCPLTVVAAKYTTDRRPNFDIYLPQFLARWNKMIFGSLYVAGLVYLLWHLL